MKVYTKTGDKGSTGLIGGTRVPKTDARIEAYGTVDELNAFVGLLITHLLEGNANIAFLRKIQHSLFVLGAYLATDWEKARRVKTVTLEKSEITEIEQEIDRLNASLPPLKYFVLPGGSTDGAFAHVCRTVARRAERRMYELHEQLPLDENVLVFINRLSDYFFVLSRVLTKESGQEDFFWKT